MKIESKTLMSIVILEHRAIIKFCVQAGKSLMVTKRFLDATGDDQHVFIFVNQRFTIGMRGLKVKELISWEPKLGFCTYGFRFISLSKLKTAETEICGPKLTMLCNKTLYKNLKMHFINGFNDMNSVWN